MKKLKNRPCVKRTLATSLAILICLSMGLIFSGCGDKSGGTYDEPEVTSDYLTGEYSQQLEKDGAETVYGFVTMDKESDSSTVSVEKVEIVKSDKYKEGYYIADKNISDTLTIDNDARIVLQDKNGESVSDIDGFMAQQRKNAEQIYKVYHFDNLAELIIPIDPADLLEEE